MYMNFYSCIIHVHVHLLENMSNSTHIHAPLQLYNTCVFIRKQVQVYCTHVHELLQLYNTCTCAFIRKHEQYSTHVHAPLQL